MSAFARLFARVDAAPANPGRAFSCGGGDISWAELGLASRRYAAALAGLGVQPGDRVAVIASPSIDNVVALLGNYRLGAIHVPINTRYRRGELSHVLSDSGAKVVVVDAQGAVALDDLASARSLTQVRIESVAGPPSKEQPSAPRFEGPDWPDDQLALMIYTSGTTGPSKGVCHDFRSVVSSMEALTSAWCWSENDTQVLSLPLFHVHGLCIGVHGALLKGVTTQLLARFDLDELHAAFAAGASLFMGVPTMYAKLLDWFDAEPQRAEAFRHARLFTAGSAALSARNFERFEGHTGHQILERYGMSETLISLSNAYAGPRRPGFVGRAVPGYEVRAVDEQEHPVPRGQVGELRVKGPGMMRGYWQQASATEASFVDGWFKTGDVVKQDARGDFEVVGRSSVDIIKSGGFKISAREIEECLMAGGDFAEVAVVGIEDETWGEKIVAAIVPRDRGAHASEAQWLKAVQAQVLAQLADYKRPRAVRLVEEIPKNALGKRQKHRLRSLFT